MTSPGQRILVFRIGQLGDTIVALPTMWAIRQMYPSAHLALLCDRHQHASYVLSTHLLKGAELFDEFLDYPVENSISGVRSAFRLIYGLRKRRFDTLAYLAPTGRSKKQINRDWWFFRLAGIRTIFGMDDFTQLQEKRPGEPLRTTPSESELLLRRFVPANRVAALLESGFGLNLGLPEETALAHWRSGLPTDGNRRWIAVGPGTKMPAKQWPMERFQSVIGNLIAEFDIWPVVFGGAEDRAAGAALLEAWGRGYNAAGSLDLRTAALALKNCALYLGNDTGTMHLASAVGIPCVAIFSARAQPGLWYPHGSRHRIFRAEIDCEGCGLVECIVRQNECLKRIGVDEVGHAAGDLLRARLQTP